MNQQVGGVRSFLPAVEGMRACAAIGVVITHVAFQTGHSSGISGRLWGRFDMAVAVFFALSGFLLWRGHAAAARGLRPAPAPGHYLRSRAVRIMPAYLVAVVVILALLPDAGNASLTVWLANLTMTQIYVPLTLTPGLTQMWSLAVEVSFYIALPLLALRRGGCRCARGCRRSPRCRCSAWAWGFLPIDTPYGVQPAELGAGLRLLVRCGHAAGGVGVQPGRPGASVGAPAVPMALVALGGVSGGRVAAGRTGRAGLGHRRPVHRPDRHGRGVGLCAAGAAGAGPARHPHRLLASAPMVTLGRWSYGIFIWHLAALDMVFPVLGHFAFTGDMAVVLVLTMVFTVAIAAVSYALVEQPCRERLRGWENRHRAQSPGPDVTGPVLPEEPDVVGVR